MSEFLKQNPENHDGDSLDIPVSPEEAIENEKITQAWDAMFCGGPIPEPEDRPDEDILNIMRLLRQYREFDLTPKTPPNDVDSPEKPL